MRITLEEARQLYAQGGMAKEIALREFTEGEILNDYTKNTASWVISILLTFLAIQQNDYDKKRTYTGL